MSPQGLRIPLQSSLSQKLTLIELLVVLSILVVVSTVALSTAVETQHQTRFEKTLNDLNRIENAIVSRLEGASPALLQQLRHSDYVSTMGAPPRRLEDLVVNPGLAVFARQTAPDASGVFLYCGWRGPYLRLPLGQSTFKDGWGKAFELLDQHGTLIQPLGSAPVEILRSLGSDQALGGSEGYQSDMISVLAASAVAVSALEQIPFAQDVYRVTLDVFFQYQDQSTGTTTLLNPLASNGAIQLFYYAPDPLTGQIQITTETISTGELGAGVFRKTIQATVGSRALRAIQKRGSQEYQSSILYLDLLAGKYPEELLLVIVKPAAP
jgi:type II secretory pathway pseudopilin PulG